MTLSFVHAYTLPGTDPTLNLDPPLFGWESSGLEI
jgi:hypothetical protein